MLYPDQVLAAAPSFAACTSCRLVIAQLAQDSRWPVGQWAFDGRKNIYTPTGWLPREERTHQVQSALVNRRCMDLMDTSWHLPTSVTTRQHARG